MWDTELALIVHTLFTYTAATRAGLFAVEKIHMTSVLMYMWVSMIIIVYDIFYYGQSLWIPVTVL